MLKEETTKRKAQQKGPRSPKKQNKNHDMKRYISCRKWREEEKDKEAQGEEVEEDRDNNITTIKKIITTTLTEGEMNKDHHLKEQDEGLKEQDEGLAGEETITTTTADEGKDNLKEQDEGLAGEEHNTTTQADAELHQDHLKEQDEDQAGEEISCAISMQNRMPPQMCGQLQ